MPSYGLQKINITIGREDMAKATYAKIREIVKRNSGQLIRDVIPIIAGVSESTFQNYTRTGRVSEHAGRHLVNFTGLDYELFEGKRSLTVDDEEQIITKLKESFGEDTAEAKADLSDIFDSLREISTTTITNKNVDLLRKFSEFASDVIKKLELSIQSYDLDLKLEGYKL